MTRTDVDNQRKQRGKELRAFRKAKRITQKRLASISGLSCKTVIRIEKGIAEWRIDSELMYINALNSIT